jgi:hypothetical protein
MVKAIGHAAQLQRRYGGQRHLDIRQRDGGGDRGGRRITPVAIERAVQDGRAFAAGLLKR